jgi:hypothetical protein
MGFLGETLKLPVRRGKNWAILQTLAEGSKNNCQIRNKFKVFLLNLIKLGEIILETNQLDLPTISDKDHTMVIKSRYLPQLLKSLKLLKETDQSLTKLT